MKAKLAAIGIAALSAGCGKSAAPPELGGLWSAGPAACEAGVGVRFEPGAVMVHYREGQEVLLDDPTYRQIGGADGFRVRIDYRLPHAPGGARSVGAHGVITLERGADGALKPLAHNLVDTRTGSARVWIEGDPAMAALSLSPCAPTHPWREALRGRSEG